MKVARLTAAEQDALLPALSRWTVQGDYFALTRTFKFGDFSEAFAFMTRVALLAERANHHPEWSNVYNRVTISLTTHDAGGLSLCDTALANAIDVLASTSRPL